MALYLVMADDLGLVLFRGGIGYGQALQGWTISLLELENKFILNYESTLEIIC
jgi:hypothetical protein